MTATTVTLPDGSEEPAAEVICGGCDKPVSEHSCGSTFTVTSGAAASGSAFKTGPRRKDPTTGPLCPHCSGRLHANMASLAQDVECLARQYYMDLGTMKTPFDRMPATSASLDALSEIVTWSRSLADPITYGRMESPGGGTGTYASLKPKADPSTKRTRKAKPAEAGARIEDLARAVVPSGSGELSATPVITPVVPAPTAPTKSRAKPEDLAPPSAQAAVPTPQAQPVQAAVPTESDEQRRARRRALLAGR
jgi:hypothetical protein